MKITLKAEKTLGDFSLNTDMELTVERTGIFGQSGSGKSSIAKLLAGLWTPDRGEISIDGEPLFSSSRAVNIHPEHRRIALVFQNPTLFPHLNVRANLLYGFRRCSHENRVIQPDTLIDTLQLRPLLDRGVTNLSGGEKQRVALGRAILANPRLLLMDEPLSALDDALRFQIIPYLSSVYERFRIPYLFISHSTVEMQLMTDRVIVVSGGRIMEETTPDQLARSTMEESPRGYLNLIRLDNAVLRDGLYAYRWGETELLLSEGQPDRECMFELSSRDVILFKKHPEAISARNLIQCRVAETFQAGRRTGVVLQAGNAQLVAEVVRSAAEELQIVSGCELYAAIKASSFRKLG